MLHSYHTIINFHLNLFGWIDFIFETVLSFELLSNVIYLVVSLFRFSGDLFLSQPRKLSGDYPLNMIFDLHTLLPNTGNKEKQ